MVHLIVPDSAANISMFLVAFVDLYCSLIAQIMIFLSNHGSERLRKQPLGACGIEVPEANPPTTLLHNETSSPRLPSKSCGATLDW